MILILVILGVVVLLVLSLLVKLGVFLKFRSQGVPSRTDVLIGKTGLVTEAVDPNTGTGRVLVNGEDWAAQSVGTVPLGALIRVTGADGIVLHILPAETGATSAEGFSS